MARYGQAFKDKAVARLLPPESASLADVAQEFGVSTQTLEKWRDASLLQPAGKKQWTPAARFEALLTTAAMNEQERSAWCRAHGVYPQQLVEWRQSATEALGAPQTERSSPAQAKADRRRIKELERDLRRKDKALADPDGHPKLLHLWPVKLLQAGRTDYEGSAVMAMRAAASLSR